MAKSRKTKGPPLEQALEKGERFFQKRNFPLAKREFEAALRLGASDTQAREIADRLDICVRELAVLEGREAVKRGRKLEKKGHWRDALAQFEKALACEPEPWLEDRIAALKTQLSRTEASILLETVAADEDPQVRLAAYDKALTAGPDRALTEGKANCLVELDRFDAAIALYAVAPPSSDLSRYRHGYACAAVGRYLDAFAAWQGMETRPEGMLEQVEQLLPLACREAERMGGADPYGVIAGIARGIDAAEKNQRFAAWEEHAACARLEALWKQERFEEMLQLLPPLGQFTDRSSDRPPDRAVLALHAKVGFKLAERDPSHLESAMALWLTAVYDDTLLSSLAVHRTATGSVDRQAIRTRLVERLGVLVKRYATQGRLSRQLEGIWRMEARIVQQLSALPVTETPPPFYPCTPGFAVRYGIAEDIFAFLDRQPGLSGDSTVDLQELRAYFSAAGQAMMRMEAGEEELALAAMPRGGEDDLARYCRERIALACGMAKAHRGERRIKRHLLDALPLLEAEPKRLEELVELAYADKPGEFFEGLADAMEALCARIDTPKFRKATAHVMGIKAVRMLNRGSSPTVVEKLLERALELFPDSELVGTTLDAIAERRLLDDVAKAFRRQNPLRAAQLVQLSNDPDSHQYFFETLELWYREIQTSGLDDKRGALTEIHESCRLVNPAHPLTHRIEDALWELKTI
jgi:tetratricopeptide (TPR) repeat protein